MRKNYFLLIGLCFISASLLQAQQKVLEPADIKSAAQGKALEIKKIVEINSLQESQIQAMGETYFWKVDSAIFIVQDPEIAVKMKYDAAKKFQEGLLEVLTPEQQESYFKIIVIPYAKAEWEEEISNLMAKMPDLDISIYSDSIMDYTLKEQIIYSQYKYDLKTRDEKIEQLNVNEPKILNSKQIINPAWIANSAQRKLSEIRKMVALNPQQESQVQAIGETYFWKVDSAKYLTNDASIAENMKYEAGKEFFNSLMSILTENQQYTYLELLSAEYAKPKAQSKWLYLQASGLYNESELNTFYDEIYEFLLMEKMAYIRYRYNPDKQKENADLLRKQRPKSLLEADALEKAALDGKSYTGSYQW